MYKGHIINFPGRREGAGRAAGSAAVPVGAQDGTRLCAISECESPFMSFPSRFKPWPPPIDVFDYKRIVTTIVPFVRASVVGIVHDLGDVAPTGSRALRRTFKLADDNGAWIYCVAHGKHVVINVLENVIRICICFGTGRSQVGSLLQGLWMFPGSFCRPLGRKVVSPLLQGVQRKEKHVPAEQAA